MSSDDKKCPVCESPTVSSYPQVGGKVTVYRFACGRRDRHWEHGVGTINGENSACKEIASLRKQVKDLNDEIKHIEREARAELREAQHERDRFEEEAHRGGY